ncbi:hypothetical protein IT408_02295 [Candidatus Uhrbacteria bacterium]|nr:hypothetical protein [Candidatus Uhrbacteria bacterium]
MSINKQSLRAALAMLGTIIGAGVFAIPSVFRQYGIGWGSLIYWLIAILVLVTHLLFSEVILQKTIFRRMRLPGMVSSILGPNWGKIAFLTHPSQIIGACLAYIVLGGEFLYALGGEKIISSVLFWQFVFWAGGAVTVLIGLNFIAKIESWLTWILVASLLMSVVLFSKIADPNLFFQVQAEWAWSPIGILVFSLFGLSVIPEIVELAGSKREPVHQSITFGTLGAALLMWLFGVMAYAAAPSNDTSALGYASVLSARTRLIIPVIGFLAVATSFITLMEGMRRMLVADAKLHKNTAKVLALSAPLILLFITQRNFLSIVSFIGGFFNALNAIFATVMVVRLKKIYWPLGISGIFLLILISRILNLT